MENPYASPKCDCLEDNFVEVVSRSTWAWRNYEQIYRFRSPSDRSLLASKVRDFYLSQNTRILESDAAGATFERRGTSVFHQLFKTSEKEVPQQIQVSLDQKSDHCVVTCCYCLRLLHPDFVRPPHTLELEVQQLSHECTAWPIR